MEKHLDDLKNLFRQWSGEEGIEIIPIPAPDSERQYYRMYGMDRKAIGVYSPDLDEIRAFIYYTQLFVSSGLKVPELYASDLDKFVYIISDLGKTSLLDILEKNKNQHELTEELKSLYKKVIEELIKFQVEGGRKSDFSMSYPVKEFGERSIRWNLNYFKYYFLRLLKIPFIENELENDFERLISFLVQTDNEYFMYRDFQARNILVKNGIPHFIDYQGGCKGPLQFDLASLLFQVKANLPLDFREGMLNYYLDVLLTEISIDRQAFVDKYYVFVLYRQLQVMGAYGYHGYFERRQHYLESIPFAIQNMKWLLENIHFKVEIPSLIRCLKNIAEISIEIPQNRITDQLTVSINSFAYKNGIPPDYSGNGGGFVFDCRVLPGLSSYDHYQPFAGKKSMVSAFMEREPSVNNFMQSVYKLIDTAIAEYQRQKFPDLVVSFGSAEGKYRSVYCTEKLAAYLEEKYFLNIIVHHSSQDKKLI